jgi:aminoglycoside phosphotransferase (APT) family kinase protein
MKDLASDPWEDLVDVAGLSAWMDASGIGRGELRIERRLAGGTQNVLVLLERGGERMVLRRPPRHLRNNSDEAMLREARVLGALAASAVPHPALIAACEDSSVLGAAFYLMAPVDGFNAAADGLPLLHAADPALRHRMGLAMVDAIAALGELDPLALGLEGFGRVEGFLERQVGRWRSQLEGYGQLAGWPGPESLPGVAAVGDWLQAHRPPQGAPGILHGDYHIANVMFQRDGGELAAIVDWELSTLGDPLLDLGNLLAGWPEPQETGTALRVEPWDGFPSAAELLARYAQRSRRNLRHVRWYTVLACYKTAVILEGTYARACAGMAPKINGERLHAAALRRMSRALRLGPGFTG